MFVHDHVLDSAPPAFQRQAQAVVAVAWAVAVPHKLVEVAAVDVARTPAVWADGVEAAAPVDPNLPGHKQRPEQEAAWEEAREGGLDGESMLRQAEPGVAAAVCVEAARQVCFPIDLSKVTVREPWALTWSGHEDSF